MNIGFTKCESRVGEYLLLFSPKSRGSFKFEITSNMVIIDEAHLSPDIACAACSLEVDLAKLKQFLREHLPRL